MVTERATDDDGTGLTAGEWGTGVGIVGCLAAGRSKLATVKYVPRAPASTISPTATAPNRCARGVGGWAGSGRNRAAAAMARASRRMFCQITTPCRRGTARGSHDNVWG
jgi:hypothetical protein